MLKVFGSVGDFSISSGSFLMSFLDWHKDLIDVTRFATSQNSIAELMIAL